MSVNDPAGPHGDLPAALPTPPATAGQALAEAAAAVAGQEGAGAGEQAPAWNGEDRRGHEDRRRSFQPASVYPVGEERFSILNLLGRFSEERWQRNGISRLADLHLKVGEAARYRLDGDLAALEGASRLTHEMVKALVYPLLRADQVEKLEREYPQDVDAAFHLEEAGGMNFRINAFHDRDGLAAVIRSLPQTVPPIETLGFPEPEVLKHMLHLHQGLVVITGITGSGKSTTIASLLAELNKRESLRVITLEDPIEYVMKNDRCLISQREVGLHTPTFHGGLRSALREDPDVIVVGEIRDTETASLALSAAETGHLVFSTLHTRDAKGVITRVVDLFPPERSKEVMSQLSFSLAYVVAQKLVPRKDGKGRVACYEVLKNVSAIGNLIRTGNWHQIYSTIQMQAKEHMITLEKHLMQLVARGVISLESAQQYANDPSQLLPVNGHAVPAGA